MRKLSVCVILALSLALSVSAKSGDINGAICETDITATINGISVPSYNIGGRTVVIVEDITTAHYYNDKLRTLIIGSLAPDSLVEGENTKTTANIGARIGNTYETDIVTYVYDKQIPCYSLNGKMAVAIEDLGGDNTFNKLGGRYVWDAEKRTISLEFIYADVLGISDILHEKHMSLSFDMHLAATFVPDPIMHGSMYGITVSNAETPRAMTAHGKTFGYLFNPHRSHFSDDGQGNITLDFSHGVPMYWFYEDVLRELLEDVNPVQPTREDWLAYYEMQMMRVLDSLETEEYTFLYMSQPNTHGSSQFLRRVAADGSVIEYEDNFKSVSLYGQKYFDNVTIDRENEKVTFRYDKEYTIDLNTGIME